MCTIHIDVQLALFCHIQFFEFINCWHVENQIFEGADRFYLAIEDPDNPGDFSLIVQLVTIDGLSLTMTRSHMVSSSPPSGTGILPVGAIRLNVPGAAGRTPVLRTGTVTGHGARPEFGCGLLGRRGAGFDRLACLRRPGCRAGR